MEESEAKSGVALSRLEQIPSIEQIRSTESFCPQLRFFPIHNLTFIFKSSSRQVHYKTKNGRGYTMQQEEKIDSH